MLSERHGIWFVVARANLGVCLCVRGLDTPRARRASGFNSAGLSSPCIFVRPIVWEQL